MNLYPRINQLRREAELLSHEDVMALAMTLDREPQIFLGSKPQVRFGLPNWAWTDQVQLSYEELLGHPDVSAGSDGLYLNLEEPIGEAFGVPIILAMQATADYPDSIKEMLMNLGKLHLEIQEPHTYLSLQC